VTVLDRSRRSDALWHALAKLDDDPSVRPDAHAFIRRGALVHGHGRSASISPARIPGRTLFKIPDRPIGSSAGRSV